MNTKSIQERIQEQIETLEAKGNETEVSRYVQQIVGKIHSASPDKKLNLLMALITLCISATVDEETEAKRLRALSVRIGNR